MPAEFLGVGWKFPVQADGEITRAYHEESIRDAIWIVLGTAKGERVMRPEFGCGIHDLVFSVGNASTAGVAAAEVHDALVLSEPRIEVLDVQVTSAPSAPTTLLIRIEYRVRATNNVFNIVYPFYLERSAT